MLDLDALEALEQAATPGEWHAEMNRFHDWLILRGEYFVLADLGLRDWSERNAAFIAAIRNAAPDLITAARERDKYWDAICAYAADVSRLERENNELQGRIDAALACYGPDPSKRLGESRWRSADEFLIAIRAALKAGDSDD